jgi:hypothetical protein
MWIYTSTYHPKYNGVLQEGLYFFHFYEIIIIYSKQKNARLLNNTVSTVEGVHIYKDFKKCGRTLCKL